MIVRLDKTRPNYQRKLAQLRKIAAELGEEPRSTVICFKTFEEFNEYKEMLRKERVTTLCKTDQTLRD